MNTQETSTPDNGVNQPAAANRTKPAPRAVKRAGTTQGAPNRQLHTVEKDVLVIEGLPGTDFGLPYDFGLSFLLHTMEERLVPGTQLRFKLSAPVACTVFLIQFDSLGVPCRLLPVEENEECHIPAGTETLLPLTNEDELVVGLPVGKDLVLAVASAEPTNFAQELTKVFQQMGTRPHPGASIQQAIARSSGGPWSTAYLYLQTEEA